MDEAAQAQAAQVIGHGPGGEVAAEKLAELIAQVSIGEPVRQEAEGQQGGHEGMDPAVAKAQARGSLAGDVDGVREGLDGVLSGPGFLADSLDVEQTSVGGEADLGQCSQAVQPFADVEVTFGVVDGGLGS